MKRILVISLVLVLVIILAVIFKITLILSGKTIQINDVTKKTEIMLVKGSNQENVDGLLIIISGDIDGRAIIRQGVGSKVYKTFEIGNGRVQKRIVSEWYNDECIIGYEPIDVKRGNLQIKYKFDSLWF